MTASAPPVSSANEILGASLHCSSILFGIMVALGKRSRRPDLPFTFTIQELPASFEHSTSSVFPSSLLIPFICVCVFWIVRQGVNMSEGMGGGGGMPGGFPGGMNGGMNGGFRGGCLMKSAQPPSIGPLA